MSTNPNNSVGTNGAYGGRTSVKAFNDILGVLSGRGVLSGWAVSPDNGMTVSVGGVAGKRDVAILEDNNGNRTTANNINESPILIDIPAAPASNSRIDSIVLYVDNPPQGTANAVDNPAACGLIVVSSDIAGSPTPPSDTAVRAAITADGASGSTAFFCVVADIRIAAGTTNITSNMITMKDKSSAGVSRVNTDDIVDGAVTTAKLGANAVGLSKLHYAHMQAYSDVEVTAVGQTSALTMKQSSVSGDTNLIDIASNRVRVKANGLVLVSGKAYAKSGSANQVFCVLAKYNTAGTNYGDVGFRTWSPINNTGGMTLDLPMAAVRVTANESFTIVGGVVSGGNYTIGSGTASYNGIDVFFIPDN